MDRVRLGRALGRGARMAARTAHEALEAAAAPSPPSLSTVQQRPTILRPGSPAQQRPAARGAAAQSARRRPAEIFAPFRRATRAVSLEVTGSFFALFALSFGLGVWHQWAALRSGSQAMTRFALFCGVTAFFGYCSVSSFIRARRLR